MNDIIKLAKSIKAAYPGDANIAHLYSMINNLSSPLVDAAKPKKRSKSNKIGFEQEVVNYAK